MSSIIDIKAGDSITLVVGGERDFVAFPSGMPTVLPETYTNPTRFKLTFPAPMEVYIGRFDCPLHLYLMDLFHPYYYIEGRETKATLEVIF